MPESTTPRVALVTGATRGIGRYLAEAFAQDGYVVERSSRTGGEGVTALDVTDEAAVTAYVAEVMGRHGRVDVLVNNAGVIDAEVPLWEADPADWWRTMEVDVLGPFLMCRFVVPHMLAAGGGRVVNLNSGAGTRAGEDATAYYAAKTALARITGGLHAAGFDRGIRAFDLAPGVIRTDMTTSMRSHEGRTEWTEPSDVCALALAMAEGSLDAWSGRLVRAGADTPESLLAAESKLGPASRQVRLLPWGEDDPIRP